MKLLSLLANPTLLAFAALPAHAKTYYISQSAGDDSATGDSAKTPWKTLAKASIEY